ncbi:hypothetical protein FBU30_006041 [Linnemannia zychae]|nr:hypothetical protein FBU30_006041 [Linnemannia zychae]
MSSPTLLPPSSISDPSVVELDLKEISGDTLSQLMKQCSRDSKNAVLLLDMRPSACHSALSIKTAVNVTVPNMLLKRPNVPLELVTEHLTTEKEAEAFSNWRRYSNIVLFDATGATPVKGTPLFCIAQKFRKEGYSARIGYIQGGFNAFAHDHADLCCSENTNSYRSPSSLDNQGASMPVNRMRSASPPSSTTPGVNTSPPRSRLHLGSLPVMVSTPTINNSTAETPMIENPNVNPLFESVRQAMGLNTNITEEIPIRLPEGSSLEKIRKCLPTWLLDVADESSGKSRLAKYFQKVEVTEKKRLALLMCPQMQRSGKMSGYSIGSGIEKGLKNRYNNVWPFDHTRVKIKQLEHNSDDDYINASLLTPPFGRQSYIATQAPLPSTFLDFWKVIWEQNSRVIVMLTKEVEMGRIKCHTYWPTIQEPVLDLGNIQVTFMSECYPYSESASILVRQVRLRHMGLPQEPERTITQLQFTGWPDFGVPETPLEVLQLFELTELYNSIGPIATVSTEPLLAGPIVVHCSAGCGRTGAFCVIDSILSELKYHPESILGSRLSGDYQIRRQQSHFEKAPEVITIRENKSDEISIEDVVFATVIKFREQRLSMVQCLRQYVFCYEAILWHLAKEFTKDSPAVYIFSKPWALQHISKTSTIIFPPQKAVSDIDMLSTPTAATSEESSYFS